MAADFEHLMPKNIQRTRCPTGRKHRWVPSGTIEAKLGDNIRVDFYCKLCNRTEVAFLSKTEYNMHERLLIKNIQTLQEEGGR